MAFNKYSEARRQMKHEFRDEHREYYLVLLGGLGRGRYETPDHYKNRMSLADSKAITQVIDKHRDRYREIIKRMKFDRN